MHRKSENGFTLIDVSMMLIIAGALLSGYLSFLMVSNKSKENTEYFGAVTSIADALESYAINNGAYPVPAAINLATTDLNYGIPVNEQVLPLTQTLPDLAANECDAGAAAVNGLFCRIGARDLDSNGIGEDNEETILIGSLPTSVLGLNSEESLDKHSSRYTYAISRGLTDPTTFSNDNGVLQVLSQEAGDALNTSRDVHYVVLSHGNNQSGSYVGNGTLSQTLCDGNLDALEFENCDNDAVFQVLTSGNETAGTTNLNILQITLDANGNYFDDAVAFNNEINGEMWTARAADRINMTSGIEGDSKMFIGASAYETAVNGDKAPQLWVNGGARASQALTKKICDQTQTNCFRIEDITLAGTVLTDDGSDTPKQLKCVNRGFKSVSMINGQAAWVSKSGKNGEADGECDVNTKVINSGQLGASVAGVICTNGASGRNADGTLKCL